MESETDTEEYEKIQTSAQEMKNVDVSITVSIRPEMSNMSTSTEMVEMTNCETLTEVCKTKSSFTMSKSLGDLNFYSLQTIPELAQLTKEQSREDSDIEVHSIETNIAEFINSEFYIDESLPSSLMHSDEKSNLTNKFGGKLPKKSLIVQRSDDSIAFDDGSDDDKKATTVMMLLQVWLSMVYLLQSHLLLSISWLFVCLLLMDFSVLVYY